MLIYRGNSEVPTTALMHKRPSENLSGRFQVLEAAIPQGSAARLQSYLCSGHNVYLMTPPFLDLLKRIADGIVIYEPFPRNAQGLREFQDTVHRLREMERLGLIGRLFVQTRTSRDAEQVDMVMVQGGLTVEGQRLLADQSRQAINE
jgi:hypothetical protein